MRALVVGIAVLVVAFLGWRYTQIATAPVPATPARVTGAKAAGHLPVSSVLDVRPERSASDAQPPAKLTGSRDVSPNIAQLRARSDYAGLQHRLAAAPDTPESLYLKAEVYSRCARRDGNSAQQIEVGRANSRAKFLAGVPANSAAAADRVEAFDKLAREPCAGLDVGAFNEQQLARMIAAAADAGDPRAQAWQLGGDIYQRSQARHISGYSVSGADFAQMQSLLATGDPQVIHDLADVLSSTLEHGSVTLNGEPVDGDALHHALALLACDVGEDCGSDSPDVLLNCAYRGKCEAGNLYEYTFYYGSSPSDAQLIDRYRRSLLAMMNAHDMSGLALSPADTVSGYTRMYAGSRLGHGP